MLLCRAACPLGRSLVLASLHRRSCPCRHAGGAIVRTDLGSVASGSTMDAAQQGLQEHRVPAPKPACLLLKGNNTVTRNRATSGAGGGLLVINTTTAFAECRPAGTVAGLVPLEECWAGAGGAGPAALAARGLPYGNQAKDPGTDNLASIAARLVVTCADGSRHDDSHECTEEGRPQPAVVSLPGSTLRVVVEMQDWRGSRVVSGANSNTGLQVSWFKTGMGQ